MKATVRMAARSSTVALGLALAVTGCGTIEGRSPDAGAGRHATVAGAPEKPGSAEVAKGLPAAKQATDMATLASRVEAPLAMARQAKAASDWQGPRTQRVVLEEQKKLVADAPWQNTLGMEFVPVPGTEVQFCKWETRVQDYEAFVKARGVSWHKPSFGKGFKPGPTHPAVNVSWADATAFCEWLTATERNMGLIASHQSYRLPRDWEWSVAVGLNEPRSGSPQDKDSKIEGVYPWGTRWPPPREAGNYGPSLRADDFPYTSPVGSFAANRFGLYDLGGNAWEWCEESYNGQSGDRVARGGSAYFFAPRSLLSSYRLNYGPDFSNDLYGFRCVLVVRSAR
jgi:formylglycine-generating enzyme required for sulfatase activity